ncbi:hypothetical protein BASA62_005216 [Batrachochytrium salamandrivorans]|nr:hypothetical protein BASA62_005216 [Batrachochytrium salamandrivorans]
MNPQFGAPPSRLMHTTTACRSSNILSQELPYPNGLSKLLNPVGYLKWKMNVMITLVPITSTVLHSLSCKPIWLKSWD